ncbi:hypothetical protein BT69DRAFT_1318968 [Atractiella rhizophila]|nr:hypothetical protein BT69DRAFT_1318968 [Atractiella rhizophila]
MTARKRETTRARAVEPETSHPPLDDEPPQGIIRNKENPVHERSRPPESGSGWPGGHNEGEGWVEAGKGAEVSCETSTKLAEALARGKKACGGGCEFPAVSGYPGYPGDCEFEVLGGRQHSGRGGASTLVANNPVVKESVPHSLKWDERRCVLGMQTMSSAKEGAETREEVFGGRGEGDWELEGDGWEARRGEASERGRSVKEADKWVNEEIKEHGNDRTTLWVAAMNGNGKLALAVDYDCCHSIMSAKLPDELAYSWWSTSRLEVGVGNVVSN